MTGVFIGTAWAAVESSEVATQTDLILSSYKHFLGKKLFDHEDSASVYNAEFIVLSHDGQKDPCFTYANKAAQELWKISWSEFIGLPSKFSAAKDEREGRDQLLKDVQQNGFSENGTAIRIDKLGRKFFIENLTVWNLLDGQGGRVGQAATYQDWHYLDE